MEECNHLSGAKVNRETVSTINHRWVKIALVILLTTYVIGIALMASVPPVSRDALIHHLAVPKLYLQHGGMIELPDIPFSLLPHESRSVVPYPVDVR